MADKKSAEQLQAAPEPIAAPRKLDYAPQGGRYVVNGKLVDANGQPVPEPLSTDATATGIR